MTLNQKLATIQTKFKSKKSRFNSFGKYYFRSAEDILEATKPYLLELGVTVTINENLVETSPVPIIESCATISDGEHSISVSAFAREALTQKGMSDSQLTGATSSYARKYALNGLFLIDDNKDADTDEAKGGKKEEPKKPVAASKDSFRRPKKKQEPAQEAFDDI